MLRKFFFYGTLKNPRDKRVKVMPYCRVVGYEMWMPRKGWFPCAIATNGKVIEGVLHDYSELSPKEFITTLADFDFYEGVPALYTRKNVSVILPSGDTVQAWMYAYNKSPDDDLIKVPNGVWE